MLNLNGSKMDKYELLEHIEAIVLNEKSFVKRLEWDRYGSSIMFINMFGKCVGKVYVGEDSPVEMMMDVADYVLGGKYE